jgi:hypothetical protein
MGKLHKRTHLGVQRVSKRERKEKPLTAQLPPRAGTFATEVPGPSGTTHHETAPGCYRTYTPPEGEG